MVETTRQNFKDMLPKIKHALNSADFISIGTEVTGFYFDDESKPSLFDNSTERYLKIKKNVQKFTLSRLGLTTFSGSIRDNRYQTETFLFYLCPFSFGSLDQRFCLQASNLQYLCKHKFNFNKWFNEGIPYLNSAQEKEIEEELESGLLFAGIERDVDEKEVQSLCSLVAAWLPSSSVGECLTLSISEGSSSQIDIYHKNLCTRFFQIWTTTNDFGQIVVERVDRIKRDILERQGFEFKRQQERTQLHEMLGFTHVFHLLQSTRKPIVGHNLLMALMFVYEKFYQPLPDTIKEFKREIHRVFPVIFDTKHINHSLRKPLESLELFKAEGLLELYNILNGQYIMSLAPQQPSIILFGSNFGPDAEQPPNAGYDSYLSGCVFLRLCHLIHSRTVSTTDIAACSFKTYLPAMKNYRNCINVTRAIVSHIKLDGGDPPSQRSALIHVQAIKSGGKLVLQQLAVWFSVYGTVDIQMINSRQAVVATTNFNTAQDIISAFKNHGAIRVTKYTFWEHFVLGHSMVIGSLALSTGIVFLLFINVLRS